VYKKRSREAEADPKAWHPILIKVRLSRGMLLLCMFTFLNLATKSFEVLGCSRVDGVHRMIAAPTVVCYTGGHAAATAVACIIIVYTLVFPVLVAHFLYSNKERLFVEDILLMRMGSLYENFRHPMFGAYV
jgi:hypothetical protein